MTSRSFSLFSLILLLIVAVVSFYSPANTLDETKKPTEAAATSSALDSRMFDNILDRIKKDYVEDVKDDKLLAGALNGMLSALDPHSAYLDPKSYEELKIKTSAEYGGLGMEVTMENGLVKIISPIDDTPAQKADLQTGDLIVAIDKKPVTGMTLNEAVELMRGKPGVDVKLHIKREGQDIFEKVLKREIIHVKAVKWHTEGNVGYIRIATFNEKTAPLLHEAIIALKKQLGSKLEGFVVDVRNNPGGLLYSAIDVCNFFLNKGQEIVSTRGRNPKEDTRSYAELGDQVGSVPIVVLINSGSASASEILAGAIQDNHRGLIVGTKSFGKGSVQAVMPLTNEGAITLTIARYYTPSGRSIQAKGIEPDIVIDQVHNKLEKIDESEFFHEKDIAGALDTPKSTPSKDQKKPGESEAITVENDKKKKEIEDYQLMRAIDIVRTMALTQKYDKDIKKAQ